MGSLPPCLSTQIHRVALKVYSTIQPDDLIRELQPDATVVEDDTYHVLSADPAFREPKEHPIRIHTSALEAQPTAWGSIRLVGHHPVWIQAVIHDLSVEPTTTSKAVKTAWQNIFLECQRQSLGSLLCPLLGTVHGTDSVTQAFGHLEEVLRNLDLPTRLFLFIRPGDRMFLEACLDGK